VGENGRLRLSIGATPEPLPVLPAAIEVAAYRITLEAVTNVVRHAQARQCVVRLQKEPGHLALLISDDGVGLPPLREAGLGQTSMRERAEELGGTCTVVADEGRGTRVTALLPFTANGENR
jgi:signal transduction histidine kinase